MKWSFSNELPIYSQLIEQIKAAIVTGQFAPGERLPSVRDMAAEAGVNPNTLQRAFAELEREGLVYSQRTAGRMVTEDMQIISRCKTALAEKHMESFLSAMAVLGYSPAQSADAIKSYSLKKGENSNECS